MGLMGRVLAVLLCLLNLETAFAEDPCHALAMRVRSGIDITFIAKEPESAMALLISQVTEPLQNACTDSAELAYLHLRMQELGAGFAFPVGILTPEQSQLVQENARKLRDQYPHSAAITTLYARQTHSVQAAQQAVALDPQYPPARAALADALLRNGQPQSAYAQLMQIPDLSVLSDGFVVLARIEFAAGNLKQAIQAANNGLTKRKIGSLIEPESTNFLPICQAKEILGLAYLQQSQYTKAARALISARLCSDTAVDLLEHPTPDLKKVLLKINYQ